MTGEVVCVNVRNYGGELSGEFVYCGRKCYGYDASVLRNRFKNGNRVENIQAFRKWLFENYQLGEVKAELDRLVAILRSGENVILGCWCKPKSCHTDVIKSCLEYLLKK